MLIEQIHVVRVHLTKKFIRGVNIKFKYFNALPKKEQQIDPKTTVHRRVSGGISIFLGNKETLNCAEPRMVRN